MDKESERGVSWSKEILKRLIEGKLDEDVIREIQRQPKDEDRFAKMLEIDQERVPWKERILVPLQEHLYVIEKEDGARVVKCFCGQEFGNYRENWKLKTLVFERNPKDGEIYEAPCAADPEWMILREFYCPRCAALLDVEPVPQGYPFIFSQIPDIDGFYNARSGLRRKISNERKETKAKEEG